MHMPQHFKVQYTGKNMTKKENFGQDNILIKYREKVLVRILRPKCVMETSDDTGNQNLQKLSHNMKMM